MSALIKFTKHGHHKMNVYHEKNGILQIDFQQERDIERRREVQVWLDAPEATRYFFGRNQWGEKVNEKFNSLGFYLENEPGCIKNSDLKSLHALSLPVGVLPLTAFRKALSLSRPAIDLFSFLHLT